MLSRAEWLSSHARESPTAYGDITGFLDDSRLSSIDDKHLIDVVKSLGFFPHAAKIARIMNYAISLHFIENAYFQGFLSSVG